MLGQVYFFLTDPQQILIPIGSTKVLPYMDALNIYAETPNPASQMIKGENEEELAKERAILFNNINDPVWLADLFQCI